MTVRKNPRLQSALVGVAFAGLVGVPLLAAGLSDEVARLLAQGWIAYVAFLVLVGAATPLLFVGPRVAAMAVSAILLVGGFLFFFYLPWIVLPLAAFLAASWWAPRTFHRRRGIASH